MAGNAHSNSKMGYPIPALFASHRVWKEMLIHCLEERPYEACGLLSGRMGRVETIWRMVNVDRSPVSFYMDPEQIRTVFQAIQERGEQLAGVYHSHPTAPPIPSKEDIAYATYPEAAYLIVSLANKQPTVGSYRIIDQRAIPIPVTFFA